jgi:1-acyl-sn-glycerol-3-phosphate acyltransferase
MSRTAPPTDHPQEPVAVADRPAGPLAARAARGLLGQLAGTATGLRRTATEAVTAPARTAASAAQAAVRSRVRPADLDDRDSLLVRDALPIAGTVASLWFRAEVRGLHHIPRDRPVLFVGNHSGGAMTPDSFVFALGFTSFFGPERPLHVLVDTVLTAYPGLGILRRLGALPADDAAAREALDAGSCVLVYPGGHREAHRPSWQSDRVDLGDDTGVIRLALDAGVPIVPVVSIGGQETALFLGRGEALARRLGLDRRFGIGAVPLSIAPPWGLNVGDVLGHLPLPSKLVVQVLPPVDLRAAFGPEPDERAVLDRLSGTMQEMLTELGRRRRLPVVG